MNEVPPDLIALDLLAKMDPHSLVGIATETLVRLSHKDHEVSQFFYAGLSHLSKGLVDRTNLNLATELCLGIGLKPSHWVSLAPSVAALGGVLHSLACNAAKSSRIDLTMIVRSVYKPKTDVHKFDLFSKRELLGELLLSAVARSTRDTNFRHSLQDSIDRFADGALMLGQADMRPNIPKDLDAPWKPNRAGGGANIPPSGPSRECCWLIAIAFNEQQLTESGYFCKDVDPVGYGVCVGTWTTILVSILIIGIAAG